MCCDDMFDSRVDYIVCRRGGIVREGEASLVWIFELIVEIGTEEARQGAVHGRNMEKWV